MAKKQTIIKKPNGNGNISITIENNLKNTNIAPPVVKKKRRRKKAPTEEVNLPPPRLLPPLKDVSYIKPPSDRFTVWRDNLDDSFNTTIPQGQAQQMGLLRSLATPALTNQQTSEPPRPRVSTEQISTQTTPTPIAPMAIYDPLGISDDLSTAPTYYSGSAPSVSSMSSMSSLSNEFPFYTRFLPNDESSLISRAPSLSAPSTSYYSGSAPSTSSYLTAPSISSSSAPSTSSYSLSSLSAPSVSSSVSSKFMRELMTGFGRENAYDDNLHYDPSPNESIQDRFSDRSSLASFYSADQNRSPTPPLPAQERSLTPPLPAQERSLTPPLPAKEQADKPFAVDIYEEFAQEKPGISVDEAGEMLAADENATARDVQEFYKGKQSIITTAKSQGKRHGRSGKEMQGKYFHMQEYIDSYLVGRGEYDAKIFLTMDQDSLSIDPENLYRNSFTRIKNLVNMGTEKRQTRAKTRAKTRNEDIEAGSRNI